MAIVWFFLFILFLRIPKLVLKKHPVEDFLCSIERKKNTDSQTNVIEMNDFSPYIRNMDLNV